MPDFDDDYENTIVMNLIYDAIFSDSDSIKLFSRHLCATRRAWITAERLNTAENTPQIPGRNSSKIALH